MAPETDEQLTKRVVNEAITTHRAYWWEIPPRGERPYDLLPKHRPRDVAKFVRPYLQCSDEMTLLWTTACAAAWGGSASLNNLLIHLAHDDKLHVETRKNAVDAVFASGEKQTIRELYDLLDSKDDQVRGHVLRAYRMTESPTPRDYIAKLYGGAYNEELFCLLQSEVSSFGLSLDTKGLREACQEVSCHFQELGNLRRHLLAGLLRRAAELDFDDIPPPLVVSLWVSRDVDQLYYKEPLKELMASSRGLFARVWNYVMDQLRREDLHFALGPHIAEVCDDQVFDLLPTDKSALTRAQEWLIQDVLRRHFNKEPTADRLEEFNERAPTFTAHFQLPRPKIETPSRDRLESRRQIATILGSEEARPYMKAARILRAITQILHGDDRSWIVPAQVIEFLGEDLSAPLQRRVVEIFEACVSELEYSRTQLDEHGQFRMTLPQFAVPFWVLWHRGFEFSAGKLDEFLRCYAFSGFPPLTEVELYFPPLDKLADLDPGRWCDTVRWLIESPHTSSHGPLKYLIARESDVYVQRCRQRLSQCEFDIVYFDSLLDYWLARRPPDFKKVLRTCYKCTVDKGQPEALLYTLLTEDDDWAWDELRRYIEAENPPQAPDQVSMYRLPRLPLNPTRLPVLADWYACVRRNREDDDWPNPIERLLQEAIVRIDGEEALQQLQRLRHEKAFPGAEWLSHAILRVEDQMLANPGEVMEPGQLLDFVNREALGVVLNERDLFEWVCYVIEDVKEGAEKRGEQVDGYWNSLGDRWEPKPEPGCQNVLWPAVKGRLSNLGIVGIEERLIRTGKADFWVEKATRGEQAFRVAIELKVARKGYGPKRLVEPLRTQLWQQYLEPSGCRHGVYIVLWFKDYKRYHYPRGFATPEHLLEKLNQCRDQLIAERSVDIACYVIDMTTPTRLH